jgi:hypothetical protein
MTIDTRNRRTPRGVEFPRAGRFRNASAFAGSATRRTRARQLDETAAGREGAWDYRRMNASGARVRDRQARVSAGASRGLSRGIMPPIGR